MSKEKQEKFPSVGINCEEWANAKPSRKASKSVFIV